MLQKLFAFLAQSRGEIPDSRAGLLALPGVGPPVAGAMLSFHLGQRAILVDANVVRWVCRLLGREMNGETRRQKWLLAFCESLTPARNVGAFNYALLDFTMQICATKPRCGACPLRRDCVFGRANRATFAA